MIKNFIAALFLVISLPALAGEPSVSGTQGASTDAGQPSDLTLSNFFSAGWDDAYDKRVDPDGAPDMALLHVQTNFLERELRFDDYFQQNVGGDKTRSFDFFDALLAYSFNRRFMLEAVWNNEWLNPSKGDEEFGAAAALLARFQLIDVPGSSYAFNFRVTTANPNIGVYQTIFSPSLAGWQDLTRIGLKKVGLYYSFQYEGYEGGAKAGSKHNDIIYAASLAKTWTDRDTRFIGNFTTFCEFYGTTTLDGSDRGTSAINATPGIRFNITRTNVIMAGVDLPISSPHDFDATYRLTYIINF